MNFCTIIAKNYLAHARVLARSLIARHPDARLWTLIIDDFSAHVDPAKEPFEVLTPFEIGCQPFMHMAIRYSVLELSTAVKPWLLRHLMDRTGGPVTYLDPDIRVYGSLMALEQLASRRGLVLTPHSNEPIPSDGRKPSQIDIMVSGAYNLGFVSLAPRPEVEQMLDWWADRLRRDCRVDPLWGYFVDQRWFDLAPGFLTDLAIVRDPEYNVAYWNLHSRRLRYGDGGYTVNGRPLAFFHFSGFDPAHPAMLSRHQNRIEVDKDPVLARLLADYATEVIAAGHGHSSRWPYTYSGLGDGTPLDDLLRALYGDYEDEYGEDLLSPFTLAGARAFRDWIRAQAPDAPPGVNRILARAYRDRKDLRRVFPDLYGADRVGFLRWAREYGPREVPLIATAMSFSEPQEPAGQDALIAPRNPIYRSAVAADAPWGVNVIEEGGVPPRSHRLAGMVIDALDACEIPAFAVDGSSVADEQSQLVELSYPFAVNIICADGDRLPAGVARSRPEMLAGHHNVALWTQDCTRLPERWADSFSLLDEVWVPSRYLASVLKPLSPIPVTTVRLPIDPSRVHSRSRERLGLRDDEFLFLLLYDGLGAFEAQNPVAVIDAFRHAFDPNEGARLLISCGRGVHDHRVLSALRDAAAGRGDIETLHEADDDLLALSDCYVSLHRTVAAGVVMAQAMALGKPVVATGYSGNIDFMTPDNSLLVDYALAPRGAEVPVHPEGAVWAEPDIGHAAALMRSVFEDPERTRELGRTAAADIGRTHSPSACGEIMRRRLESIRATGRMKHPNRLEPRRPPALAALPLRLRLGPTPRPGITRTRYRVYKLLLRLMRPYTSFQSEINEQLVAAIDELESALVEIRRAAAVDRAYLLAELRRRGDQLEWDGTDRAPSAEKLDVEI